MQETMSQQPVPERGQVDCILGRKHHLLQATTDEHTSSKNFVFTAYQNTSGKQTKFLPYTSKLLILYNIHVEHFPSYELVLLG